MKIHCYDDMCDCMYTYIIESPVVQDTPAKVSDLKHTPQHKIGWLGEEEREGGGKKSSTPHRYLSKKESDERTGETN